MLPALYMGKNIDATKFINSFGTKLFVFFLFFFAKACRNKKIEMGNVCVTICKDKVKQ